MDSTRQMAVRSGVAIIAGILAGSVVFLLLFPGVVFDTFPQQCVSAFGYSVPCDSGTAVQAGAATAAAVSLLLWAVAHGTQHGWIAARAVAITAAGLVVFFLIFPASRPADQSDCSSVLGYSIPCGAESSIAAAGLAAVSAAFLLRLSQMRTPGNRGGGS